MFCVCDEMTREHLLADWIYRAFQKSRKPTITPMQRHGDGPWQFGEHGRADQCASVLCRACNNEWASTLDLRASDLLKPLVRGGEPFTLDPRQQRDAARWCVKTVMVNDLVITAGRSRLSEYAAAFRATGDPADCLQVWIGPPRLPRVDKFRLVGVMPSHGVLTLGTGATAREHTLHAWSLMLGYADLVLRPSLRWIPLPSWRGISESGRWRLPPSASSRPALRGQCALHRGSGGLGRFARLGSGSEARMPLDRTC